MNSHLGKTLIVVYVYSAKSSGSSILSAACDDGVVPTPPHPRPCFCFMNKNIILFYYYLLFHFHRRPRGWFYPVCEIDAHKYWLRGGARKASYMRTEETRTSSRGIISHEIVFGFDGTQKTRFGACLTHVTHGRRDRYCFPSCCPADHGRHQKPTALF